MSDTKRPSFHAVIVFTVDTNGGHIGRDGKALCGVEKRFPNNETQSDFMEDKFVPWFKINEPFICRNCLRIYKSKP